MGASRLRVSYDIQYEVENFEVLMEEALKVSLEHKDEYVFFSIGSSLKI